MPEIVIVEKTGALRAAQVADCELATLWKKAGFKTAEGFQLRHVWGEAEDMECRVSLYGKTEGRAGSENKYDFPPPPDKCLFFGSCVLVAWDPATNEAMDLDVDAWKGIYEYLFGGFEDLTGEEEEEDVDTDEEFQRLQQASASAGAAPIERTKDNYLKDGFVVDDDEEISYASSSDGSWKDGARKTGKRLKPSAAVAAKGSASTKRSKSAAAQDSVPEKEPKAKKPKVSKELKPKKIKAAKQSKEPKEPKSRRPAKSKSAEAAGAANTDKLYMYLLPGTSPQEPPLQMFAFERDNASLLLTNPRPPELSEVFEQFEDELQEETYD